ncbi:MAG: hypothetical protein ACREJ4_00755 [Candidatus Methylomirabilaceae bacterium]
MLDSGWLIKRVGLRIVERWRALVFRLVFRDWLVMSPHRSVFGIAVVVLSESDSTGLLFAKLEQAIRLIAEADPYRLARIRRDIARILVVPGGGDFFHAGLQACVIDEASARGYDVPELSLVIVHEAAHARIHRRHIPYEDSARARIEAACVRAEYYFARRASLDARIRHDLHGECATNEWAVEDRLRRRRSALMAFALSGRGE